MKKFRIKCLFIWITEKLGENFKTAISTFDKSKVNIIPLLHRSISGKSFLISDERFCGTKENYFKYSGGSIGEVLVKNKNSFEIWMK